MYFCVYIVVYCFAVYKYLNMFSHFMTFLDLASVGFNKPIIKKLASVPFITYLRHRAHTAYNNEILYFFQSSRIIYGYYKQCVVQQY